MSPKKKIDLFEISKNIAEYYGFNSIEDINKALEENLGNKKHLKKIKSEVGEADRLNIMKAYLEHELHSLPQPLLIYHTEPYPKSESKLAQGKNAALFSLEVIGVQKSIGEAIIFRTVETIFKEAGFENNVLEINSIGDRDTISKFTREFNNYYKKHVEEVPSHCRSNLKKDVFKVLSCAQDKCMLIKSEAPRPIEMLSEENRIHFGEVVEFIEGMKIPYDINNCLVGGKDFYTKTIFEFKTTLKENPFFKNKKIYPLLGKGGRYDDLSKKLGYKKEVPSVGITLYFGGLPIGSRHKKKSAGKKAKIYLIQLGFEAKLKSFAALEILRKMKIPIIHSLSKDRISAQISLAERFNVPFTLIIGQKEALEGSVIVRNMNNRSQETVMIENLPQYLKEAGL